MRSIAARWAFEFQNTLAVVEARALGIEGEHGVLGLVERFDTRLEQAAAVLAV
jgi:hypothetical protein